MARTMFSGKRRSPEVEGRSWASSPPGIFFNQTLNIEYLWIPGEHGCPQRVSCGGSFEIHRGELASGGGGAIRPRQQCWGELPWLLPWVRAWLLPLLLPWVRAWLLPLLLPWVRAWLLPWLLPSEFSWLLPWLLHSELATSGLPISWHFWGGQCNSELYDLVFLNEEGDDPFLEGYHQFHFTFRQVCVCGEFDWQTWGQVIRLFPSDHFHIFPSVARLRGKLMWTWWGRWGWQNFACHF